MVDIQEILVIVVLKMNIHAVLAFRQEVPERLELPDIHPHIRQLVTLCFHCRGDLFLIIRREIVYRCRRNRSSGISRLENVVHYRVVLRSLPFKTARKPGIHIIYRLPETYLLRSFPVRVEPSGHILVQPKFLAEFVVDVINLVSVPLWVVDQCFLVYKVLEVIRD